MRKLIMPLLALAGLAASPAAADGPKIDIVFPLDGAKLDVLEQNKLDYSITPGGGGDHIHLYLDGKEAALLRQMKGSYTLESLAPGMHEICIRIVNKNHTPIGVERCIKVTAE